jgi:hypothetical protein
MSLQLAQYAALKSYIQNDATLNAFPNTPDGNFEVARLLNLDAAPAFVVWKSSIPTSALSTTLSYVAIGALTTNNQQQLQIFIQLNPQNFNPSLDARSFFTTTFAGALAGGGQATRDALDALYRRNCSVIEKIYATGTGTTVSPATLVFEGKVSITEVQSARSS